jgi:CDP-diacylglycerol--serine O-phosphatidyltransferase
MNMISPGTAVFDQVLSSVKILLIAAVFDILDGALARAMNVKSKFGAFFDSMADAVSFGVAPSVLVLKTLSIAPGTVLSAFVTVGAMLYSVAGILRLVRFSLIAVGPSSNLGPFRGLPVTCAAFAVISPTLLLMKETFSVSEHVHALIAGGVFFVLGYLMLSRWRFPSIKRLNLTVTSIGLLALIVSLFSLLLFVAFHNFPAVLFLVSWGYVIFSLALAFVRLARGKRSSALDESDELTV